MNSKVSNKTDDQIDIIRRAYDITVDNYFNGIEDEDQFPDEFENSERYRNFKETLQSYNCGSYEAEIKIFLNPEKSKRFLDIGSCANLINKKLFKWPSIYYGIDISPKLIQITQNFVKRNKLRIGGLFISEVTKMPFENNFFDICAIVGVLEYYNVHYIKRALKEVHRVLKPDNKMFIDMPNFHHPDCNTMIELEGYLGRTRKDVPTNEEFEIELKKLFAIEKIDNTKLMTGYFVRANK